MGTEYCDNGPFTLEFDGDGEAISVEGRTGAIYCTGNPCWWKRHNGWIWRCCIRVTGEQCCQRLFRENAILEEGEKPDSPEQSS